MAHTQVLLRGSAVCLAIGVGTVGLYRSVDGVLAEARAGLVGHGAGGLSFPLAFEALCGLALLGAGAWLCAVSTLVLVQTLRSGPGREPRLGCPPWLHTALVRVVAGTCGGALVLGVSGPGTTPGATPGTSLGAAAGTEVRLADSSHAPDTHTLPGTVPAAVRGLPLPDRARAGSAPGSPRWPSGTFTVRRGDTLWDLGAASLPAAASAARIDGRWRAIYAHNRDVIGPDPDLLLPGTVLRLPAVSAESAESAEPR